MGFRPLFAQFSVHSAENEIPRGSGTRWALNEHANYAHWATNVKSCSVLSHSTEKGTFLFSNFSIANFE